MRSSLRFDFPTWGKAPSGFAIEELAWRKGDFAMRGRRLWGRASTSPVVCDDAESPSWEWVQRRSDRSRPRTSRSRDVHPEKSTSPPSVLEAVASDQPAERHSCLDRTTAQRSGSPCSKERSAPPSTRPTMDDLPVSIEVNGGTVRAQVEPRMTLADFVRDVCGLTGTHLACEHGVCGACTVLLDGAAVRSCLIFAVQADRAAVPAPWRASHQRTATLSPIPCRRSGPITDCNADSALQDLSSR